MDVLELLRDDHERILGLFGDIASTGSLAERRSLLDRMARALRSHAIIEKNMVYPALKLDPRGREIVIEAHEAHLITARLLRELEETPATDERWMAKLKVLGDILAYHVRDEHQRVFPRISAMFDEQQRVRIGTRIEATYAAARA